MDFIPMLREMANPIGGNGGAGVDDVEDFHDIGIIRDCPRNGDTVYSCIWAMDAF